MEVLVFLLGRCLQSGGSDVVAYIEHLGNGVFVVEVTANLGLVGLAVIAALRLRFYDMNI